MSYFIGVSVETILVQIENTNVVHPKAHVVKERRVRSRRVITSVPKTWTVLTNRAVMGNRRAVRNRNKKTTTLCATRTLWSVSMDSVPALFAFTTVEFLNHASVM